MKRNSNNKKQFRKERFFAKLLRLSKSKSEKNSRHRKSSIDNLAFLIHFCFYSVLIYFITLYKPILERYDEVK